MNEPRPLGNLAIYNRPERTTVAAFGWGAIQVGVAVQEEDKSVMIWLADSLEEHPVGFDPGKWEECSGQKILLGFNSEAALDVLEEAIAKARSRLRKLAQS